jgi:hypothetical protein
MRNIIRSICFLSTLTLVMPGCGDNSLTSGTSSTTNQGGGTGSSFTADYTRIDPSSLSIDELNAARALRMSLEHASVGGNILDGMNALAASNSVRYSFSNWSWHARGNPGWKAKVDQFSAWVSGNASGCDVFQMKFCYIDQDASFTYYRDAMLALESLYPSKKFIWWTMPVMTNGSDNSLRQAFNTQVREYCSANSKYLFDIASIESHDASGQSVTSSGSEAMYAAWSSDGGHLSSAGEARMAGAMWWLMVQLSK